MRAAAALLALLTIDAAGARPDIERELAQIVDLFYDLDLDRARVAAEAVEKRRPGHPSGPFYRAVAEYQRWIAEGMKSDAIVAGVESDLNAAEARAERLEKTDEAEGRYYRGAAMGFRARLLASRRQFLKAVPQAVGSVKQLKKALALDPTLEDARLGLGMYHYYAARMPAGAKPFAYLLVGEGGDRAQGLQELWQVANSTGVARMEARSALAQILSQDGELAAADKLLVELAQRYPRNSIYRLRRAWIALRLGEYERAASLADPEGAWLETLHPSVRAGSRAWALYRAAEARLLQGRPKDAERLLDTLETLDYPRRLKDWVLIRRGNVADAAGRRDAADAFYARAESGEKLPSRVAKAFRKEAFPKGPKELAPFFTGY